jgi:hypothetical protein
MNMYLRVIVLEVIVLDVFCPPTVADLITEELSEVAPAWLVFIGTVLPPLRQGSEVLQRWPRHRFGPGSSLNPVTSQLYSAMIGNCKQSVATDSCQCCRMIFRIGNKVAHMYC